METDLLNTFSLKGILESLDSIKIDSSFVIEGG